MMPQSYLFFPFNALNGDSVENLNPQTPNLIPSFHKSITINNGNQAIIMINNPGYILFNK